METLHSLEFFKAKNYFNFTKIFVLRLFKMATDQTFLMVEKSKPFEIYRRMCDVYWKAGFSQEKKCLQMGLIWAWVKKTVHGVETYWLSSKKKFWVQQSVK